MSAPPPIRILIDADACPVKDETYKVAWRHGVPVTIVANAHIRIPDHKLIDRIIVSDGFDAADDWIAETCEASRNNATRSPSRLRASPARDGQAPGMAEKQPGAASARADDTGLGVGTSSLKANLTTHHIVITADILLADRCLKAGASVLAPTGKPFTTNSIGGAIATRAIIADLRAGGEQLGGPAPFAKADRSRYLQALDAAVVKFGN